MAKAKKKAAKSAARPTESQAILTGLHNWSGHTRDGNSWEVMRGDCVTSLKALEAERFQCAVTSPPYYWQRDYKVEGQIGLEKDIDGYVNDVVDSMEAVKRVLKKDGVLFLNLGDTYYSAKGLPKGNDKKNKARRFGLRAVDASGLGVPRKTILGLPWRVAISMISKGWILRAPIIWERNNSLPEPTAKDRPWRTYEFVFLFAKHPKYSFSRSKLGASEDIWRIPVRSNKTNNVNHSATFPELLAAKCIECGSNEGDEILDPFAGSGSTLFAALKANRAAFGIDLKPEYCEAMAKQLGNL